MANRHSALAHNEERFTVIGPTVAVRGRIEGGESVRIEGRVEGSVAVDDAIFVAHAAVVLASLQARLVTVEGIVVGDIDAEVQVQLKPSARVLGNIRAPRVTVAEGASVRGEIDMGEYVADSERGAARAMAKALGSRSRPVARDAASRELAPARAQPAPASTAKSRTQGLVRGSPSPAKSAPSRAMATSRPSSRRESEADPVVPVQEPFRGSLPVDDDEADYELQAEGADELEASESLANSGAHDDDEAAADERHGEESARQAQPRMPARGKQRLNHR
jgi:cytoskeletal protein CcmA (bactofilin family)